MRRVSRRRCLPRSRDRSFVRRPTASWLVPPCNFAERGIVLTVRDSLSGAAERILGKIAVLLNDACRERERLGAEPGLRAAPLAAGDDWAVEDVLCTYRP